MRREGIEERVKQSDLPGLNATGNAVLTVQGQSGVWDGVGIIALGAILVGIAYDRPLPLISGLFLLFFGILLVLLAIPQIGKPILVLFDSGFMTPAFAFIPWSAVDGIQGIWGRCLFVY
jgi:hypothetical protein